MKLILFILQLLATTLNNIPNISKKVTLELNDKYVIELNITDFKVKEKLRS